MLRIGLLVTLLVRVALVTLLVHLGMLAMRLSLLAVLALLGTVLLATLLPVLAPARTATLVMGSDGLAPMILAMRLLVFASLVLTPVVVSPVLVHRVSRRDGMSSAVRWTTSPPCSIYRMTSYCYQGVSPR